MHVSPESGAEFRGPLCSVLSLPESSTWTVVSEQSGDGASLGLPLSYISPKPGSLTGHPVREKVPRATGKGWGGPLNKLLARGPTPVFPLGERPKELKTDVYTRPACECLLHHCL